MHGRLFERFNAIDAAAMVLIATTGFLGAFAVHLMRPGSPVITTIMPASITANTPVRLLLNGDNFRPYLQAKVMTPGASETSAEFLIGTPHAVEVQLPPLAAGSYAIGLYENDQQVARRDSAFTVMPVPSS